VLYHGGLAPRFGVETLIRAFALLGDSHDVSLRVCGSGEDRDRLAGLAAEIAPGRIDVADRPVPFADIPAELRAAHVGVVPTLHDEFTELLLPVKLLEYVHMGLPVLASDLPGIRRYFDAESVWLFEPGSPASLAQALHDLRRDPEEGRRRAARAAAALRSISWHEQKAGYLELVDRLTGSKRRRLRERRHELMAAPHAAA
jgi:glycosyltransferase involved in cell wall biosynthesis